MEGVYVRVPVPLPLALVLAPLAGALYVVVLPLIGLALLAGMLWRKAWEATGLGGAHGRAGEPARQGAQGTALAGRGPRGGPEGLGGRAMAASEQGSSLASLHAQQFALPQGLLFHPGHTWVELLRSGQVKVGLDDFLRRLLGRIEAVALPPVGVAVARGQPLARLRLGGRAMALRSPVDGTVAAANPLWETDPRRARADPYGEGWLVRVVPTNLASNLRDLRIGEPAVWWLQEEVRRFRDFAARFIAPDPALGLRLADGGLPGEGLLEQVDDAAWGRFEREFIAA